MNVLIQAVVWTYKVITAIYFLSVLVKLNNLLDRKGK